MAKAIVIYVWSTTLQEAQWPSASSASDLRRYLGRSIIVSFRQKTSPYMVSFQVVYKWIQTVRALKPTVSYRLKVRVGHLAAPE